MFRNVWSGHIAVLMILFLPTCVSAGLIAYESFDYAAGQKLQGLNGGTGFLGAWVAGGHNAMFHDFDISASSLSFENLLTAGEAANTGLANALNGLARRVDQTFVGEIGATSYLSFLIRRDNTSGVSGGFVGLYVESATGPDDLFIGMPANANQWVLETRGGINQVSSGVEAELNQTFLLVTKLESLLGNDRFTLYVDPTPGAPEPLSGTAKNDLDLGRAHTIVLYNGGGYTVDEIRVGQTFADVTPTPEPSALALCGLASLAVVVSWCRRCSVLFYRNANRVSGLERRLETPSTRELVLCHSLILGLAVLALATVQRKNRG